MKQCCETSFKYGKLSAELTASYQCILRFFHSTCLKCCACHEKVMPGHTKCCTCHAKSSSQNWRSDAPKCNPCQEISALTSQHLWWTCLLYCAYHGKRIFADPPQMSHACHGFWKCYKTLTFCSHFWQGPQSLAPATQNDASTSKSGACMLCFVHFDFEICFAPQRRALFRHLNFQKCSEAEVFCTFWLGNVLRATKACNFSSLLWPAGSARAALASLPFDPPEPQITGKTQCFATFPPFRAPASSFCWLFLFSDLLSSALLSSTLLFSMTLPISAFHLSILSEVWLQNFLRSVIENCQSLPVITSYI